MDIYLYDIMGEWKNRRMEELRKLADDEFDMERTDSRAVGRLLT